MKICLCERDLSTEIGVCRPHFHVNEMPFPDAAEASGIVIGLSISSQLNLHLNVMILRTTFCEVNLCRRSLCYAPGLRRLI